MYKRGSLFRLFYFINFTAELKRRPDRRYDCESLTAASCNRCQVHLYLYFFLFCFVSSVFFACKEWLIRFSGRGGGGGLFASIEDVFFSCEFIVQNFFWMHYVCRNFI